MRRPGSFRLVSLVALMALITLLASYRQELLNVPRVRVGPLESREPEPALPLRLFALGDTGTGDEDQLRVAAAMEQRCREARPAALLLLGDNVYQAGVSSIDDPQWQEKVFGPYGSDCLAKVPIYPVLGNHDYMNNASAQVEMSAIEPRWRMPNRFYRVLFGSLLKLVAYDSQSGELCFRANFCSLDFLLDSVKAQDAAWTIAIGHHPLANSSAEGLGYGTGLRAKLLTPFLCNTTDLYLAAHARHLEHRVVPGCRLELVVAGGGGAELHAVAEGDADVRYLRSQFGFAELELTAETMTITLRDSDGQAVHTARKQRHQAH